MKIKSHAFGYVEVTQEKNPYNPATEPASYKWWEENYFNRVRKSHPTKVDDERTYTEQELLLAVKYACGMQKAEDYQVAGHKLIVDKAKWGKNIEELLNELADCDNNDSKTITLEDLHEYFEENK